MRKKEPTIRADFYRALTNCISFSTTAIYGETTSAYKITKVEIEYPADGKKADLVVFRQSQQDKTDHPFFVIEIKGRRKYPALTLAKATIQAMNYAKKLDSTFFAVYDGWNFLLFQMDYPYLIKSSNFLNVNQYIARDLLSGLLEVKKYYYESSSLEKLPKIPDGWSFHQTIIPSIAKSLASVTRPKDKDFWKILQKQWLPMIEKDGRW